MKILILTQYYPPESGAPQNRLSDLARRLTSRGHTITVLTALPNYPDGKIQDSYIGKAGMTELIDGIEVHRAGIKVSPHKSLPKRMIAYLSFAWNAWRLAKERFSKFDILMMESPPLFLALAGMPLAKRLGAHFVPNISDLWPDSIVAMGGRIGSNPLIKLLYRLEAKMYRRASLVTGQTLGIVESIKSRFPYVKTAFFPNGVDLGMFGDKVDGSTIRREFGWADSDFVIGYCGVLGYFQALHQILDAAILLKDKTELKIALFGEGPVRDELVARVEKEKITNVTIFPRQPRERMPEIQAAFDGGLVTLANMEITRGARPSKMFEVMAAGKPLIMAAEGEAVEIVLRGDPQGPIGVVAPPESPVLLAENIRFCIENKSTAVEMGNRGRRLAVTAYDRETIAAKLERELLGLLK